MRREAAVSDLLDALDDRQVIGALPASVSGVVADSRRVKPGDCFVAVPGFRQDARRFAADAVLRGAGVVVTEGGPLQDIRVGQILVPSARRALSRLADFWYEHPSRALTDRKSTRLNSSHIQKSRMPSSA